MKTKIRRDWSDAEKKRGPCRICGHARDVQLAHVIGCEYDTKRKGPRGGKYLYVREHSVIPLCGPFSPNFYHHEYDQHRLNIRHLLSDEEWADAVSCVGEGRAMRRVAPLGGVA